MGFERGVMEKIYSDPLCDDLADTSEMTDKDKESILKVYDTFFHIYNHTWVDFDEKAANRAIEVIYATFGYKCPKISHEFRFADK